MSRYSPNCTTQSVRHFVLFHREKLQKYKIVNHNKTYQVRVTLVVKEITDFGMNENHDGLFICLIMVISICSF